MIVNANQCLEFNEKGFLLVKDLIGLDLLKKINEAANAGLLDYDNPGVVMEETAKVVRAAHGAHLRNKTLSSLCSYHKILNSVISLLNMDVYVHQFKINRKAAFLGDQWEWHQDFAFFHNEDLIQEPNLITAAIFLDDITEFNAPLTLIPGSHKDGLLKVTKNKYDEYDSQSSWLSNTTAKLRYSVDRSIVANLAEKNGLYSAKGEAGTVLFFHCNLFHCSSINMSPFDRRMILITYNCINNVPNNLEKPRPEFLSSRDHTPLSPSKQI